MAKVVTITNGSGTSELINATYTVTASVDGYNNESINPSSINVVSGTNSYAFTIGATGTLTLHVTEDGTSSGVPIVGATFVRTDASGNIYGSVVTTNASGDAVFNNVPFGTNAPVVYFKQTASDGNHDFSTSVQNTTLESNTKTVQIENKPGETRTITLTDANYADLPIDNATLTFTN